MGNIHAGEINYKDLVYSSDKDDIERYSLIRGDLLFNRTNSAEWVGKTAIYRGIIPAIFAGYLIRIRPFISSEYLNTVMNSGYAKSYCNQVKTDAVNQSNINAQKLGSFLIPISPKSINVEKQHHLQIFTVQIKCVSYCHNLASNMSLTEIIDAQFTNSPLAGKK